MRNVRRGDENGAIFTHTTRGEKIMYIYIHLSASAAVAILIIIITIVALWIDIYGERGKGKLNMSDVTLETGHERDIYYRRRLILEKSAEA